MTNSETITFSSFCLQQLIYSFGFINWILEKQYLIAIFLLSLHLYSKRMWSKLNNLCKQLSSHCRIHQGKAMWHLSTPFCCTNTASSPSPQSNFSNILCPSTPLPKRNKKTKPPLQGWKDSFGFTHIEKYSLCFYAYRSTKMYNFFQSTLQKP